MTTFLPKLPSHREFLGGDLLAQSLKHLGVDVAFGLHGGHLDAFLLGAEECGIRLIDTRHETVAVQAAEGYAKLSGKVGVCFVTANSGFSNGLPGLASAFADRSPIFCVTSSPPLRDAETNALQGFHDQVVVAKPITKFAHRITNAEEIPRLVSYAFRAANSGIKGPVLLDFPIDVLFTPPQVHRIACGAISAPPAHQPSPAPAALDQLVTLWSQSRRPVIITGTGARGTDETLLELVEATHTPTFYSNKFSTPIPFGHDLRGGPATRLAALETSFQPDFVLLLGARTGFLLGGRSGAIIPNNCTVVQVDLDGTEMGRSLNVALGIISDVDLFCTTAIPKLAGKIIRNEGWVQRCSYKNQTSGAYKDDPVKMADGQLHPFHAMNAVMNALPKDSIIIVDGGEAGQWAAMTLEAAKPKVALVAPGYLGFLGNGWGYSLGAAVAQPDRLVVNVHGDGSAGFHIQELDTFARFGLKIVTIIANNYVWGMSFNGQELVFAGKSEHRPAIRLSNKCKYDVVAEGFNCAGEYAEEMVHIQPAVKRLVDGQRPGVLNMIVSPKPITPATQGMVGMTDDKNVIVVPYYDNIPRPYFKDA